jgi:hypothetical protein
MKSVVRSNVTTILASLTLLTALLLTAVPSGAAPSIGQINTNPSQIELNKTTSVKITAVIVNHTEILVGAFSLQRITPQGPRIINLFNDLGLAGDAVRNDGIQTVVQPFRESQTGPITLRADGIVFLKTAPKVPVRLTSENFTVLVGAALPTGNAATVPGQGGTVLTISQGTFNAPMLVGIAPVPSSTVTGNKGAFSLVSGVNITAQPLGYTGGLGPANVPLNITVPRPAGVTDTEFVVGEQVLIDSLTPPEGLKVQFLARALATFDGTNIVTQPSALKGIQQGGVHAVLGSIGSAIVTGKVFNAGGDAAAGVIVSSNTNTLVDVTDSDGSYSLFVSGGPGGIGPFTIGAFHPFRGSTGSFTGTINVHGETIVNADITLAGLQTPPVTRDGIRNAGFELCTKPDPLGLGNLTGTWAFTGAAKAVTQLGPTSTGVVFLPTEGKCMVDFNTGPGAVTAVGSSLKQNFIVPAGVTQLKLDFNFVSEEFPEFVGTQFDDSFHAIITTPTGATEFATVTVNNAGTFTDVGDCFFPAGDLTCGATGWRTATVDLSAHAGTGTPITVELLFTAADHGDTIFDTHILVDNIRFGTIWVDAKILQGANANVAGIEEDVRIASEVLSQAGLIVRLRSVQTIANPGALLDTNLDYVDGGLACPDPAQRDGRRTQEEIDLLAIQRSPVATDINLYYSRSATRTDGAQLAGYAIGPDEYCNQVTATGSSGLLMMDLRLNVNFAALLAHEIGHLLISPQNATSNLEHGAGSTNFMNGTGAGATAILTRSQSANIDRPNAPLVLP